MFILICGRTGAGKTTLANALKSHGLRELISYATRPQRDENDTGHIFVSEEEFDQLRDFAATAKIGGYRYGSTFDQFDKTDFYLIDPKAALDLVRKLPKLNFYIFYVTADPADRAIHIVNRTAQENLKEELKRFHIRDQDEDVQFTPFEKALAADPSLLPDNVKSVVVVPNDYSPESFTAIAKLAKEISEL